MAGSSRPQCSGRTDCVESRSEHRGRHSREDVSRVEDASWDQEDRIVPFRYPFHARACPIGDRTAAAPRDSPAAPRMVPAEPSPGTGRATVGRGPDPSFPGRLPTAGVVARRQAPAAGRPAADREVRAAAPAGAASAARPTGTEGIGTGGTGTGVDESPAAAHRIHPSRDHCRLHAGNRCNHPPAHRGPDLPRHRVPRHRVHCLRQHQHYRARSRAAPPDAARRA